MSAKIGCIALVPTIQRDGERHNVTGFVGLKCAKGRGYILPGGKWEAPESFRDCAVRELFEETGIKIPVGLFEYVWNAPDGGGYDCFAFKSKTIYYGPLGSPNNEGEPCVVTREQLLQSSFAAYYDILFEILDQKAELNQTVSSAYDATHSQLR